MEEMTVEMVEVLEKLLVAVEKLGEERVGAIVATVDSEREAELERRLEEAEAKIAELSATTGGRKTAATGTMMAKHHEGSNEGVDAALTSLSVEQRIAVKSELLRAGVIG